MWRVLKLVIKIPRVDLAVHLVVKGRPGSEQCGERHISPLSGESSSGTKNAPLNPHSIYKFSLPRKILIVI
jgi:hypothetical protein